MPRYRKLHTKTVESPDLNDMPDDTTRLAWVLLPLALCREGRGLYNPAWLKAKLFPLRLDITTKATQEMLTWWAERKMIVVYTVDEREYFYVPTFAKYQGNTSKEAASEYPPPKSKATPELVKSKSGESQTDVEVPASASVYESESLNDDENDEGLQNHPHGGLSAAFVNATRIPEFTGGPDRWMKALDKMASAGVTREDVECAVRELREKDYTIVSLSSIVNPSINAMSRRISKKQIEENDPSTRARVEW